ncbi:hypothetical protein PIB30_008221 [Stylosanthes scabra]|uniref:Fatty acyl-CoA reductase n=1 Tax=Stylosanthes scabra TaxID=79078 RepID=A0ABU6Q5X6_9FABA|nr:hypothetical protein [Stylosanthes scabra]
MKDLGIKRTIDSVAVAYGKGTLTCSLGDHKGVIDFIPGDMVVNAMLAAMVAHAYANQANDDDMIIYHVGSSASNPLKIHMVYNYISKYFNAKPLENNKDGKPIKVRKRTFFSSMASFRIYMFIRYMLPLLRCLRWMGDYGDYRIPTNERGPPE